jgi:hypothetical protein
VGEDPKFQTWEHFEANLRDWHGGRSRRQKDVHNWIALRQTGGIDAFLDEVTRLMWITDYPENVVKNKLRDGLKRELRKEWSRVRPKPDSVVKQIAMIRDLGHAKEDYDCEEAGRSRDQDRQSSRCARDNRRHESRRSDHHSRPEQRRSEKREKKSSSSAPRSGRERGNRSSGSTDQQATRGIDSEVIAERHKNGDCLKCGKSGHSWTDCWAKEPNVSAGSSDKRKSDHDLRGSSSFMKSRTNAAAAASITSKPGRIIKIPKDEAEDPNFDI